MDDLCSSLLYYTSKTRVVPARRPSSSSSHRTNVVATPRIHPFTFPPCSPSSLAPPSPISIALCPRQRTTAMRRTRRRRSSPRSPASLKTSASSAPRAGKRFLTATTRGGQRTAIRATITIGRSLGVPARRRWCARALIRRLQSC